MDVNGRQIDTSCPYMGQCWADQGCSGLCPDTLLDVLQKTATLEHEVGFIPHTDLDIAVVCKECNGRGRSEVSP